MSFLHDFCEEMPSVISFASSSGAAMERVLVTPDRSRRSSLQLEAKVDMVYSLLAMLGGQEHADMGETLLALSTNPESCLAMRESGCIPLLVQLVQSDGNCETRLKASKALHNLIVSQPDEKLRKRESRILKLLETVCAYNEALRNNVQFICESLPEDGDKHPVQTIAHLMKLSFDEGHRQAICQLGGIHTIAKLVEEEHSVHGSTTDETHCILMRRYACMALTNLTFGDSGNKSLLCSYQNFIRALVVQLQSPSDELRQVTASVLRNLSWRADASSKDILKEVGSVNGLMNSAMMDNKENTLKSILSALWNLSAHCTENKAEICAVPDALAFLVEMLLYKSASKSLAIIENSGGILRNISSQIAVRDDYRQILREHNCLQILLDQLKSPSLTIVSNACGTLWNLSAKNTIDQELLWELGAPTMLRSLNHSKHKMIAMGSSATLKNLLSAKPGQALLPHMDSTALSLDLPALPTLGARKQKALLKDLDQNLSETYDNIEPPLDERRVKNDNRIPIVTSPNFIKSPCVDYPSTSFASLNVNEPSTSFSREKSSRIPQGSGPSSLPLHHIASELQSPTRRSDIYDVADHSDNSGFVHTNSGRKSAKSKGRSAVPRKTGEGSRKLKASRVEREVSSGYAEIGADHPENSSLRCREFEAHSSNIGEGAKESCVDSEKMKSCAKFGSSTESGDLYEANIIDNDKHKTKVIKNMDEKDHCSTEDISDSEINQVSTYGLNYELELLDYNHDKCSEFKQLSVDCSNDKSDVTFESRGISKREIIPSDTPTYEAHPSPKPRKFNIDAKPQPAPRSLPKTSFLEDEVTKVDVDYDLDNEFDCLVAFEDLEHPPFLNIPKHEVSVEDNTLQKEELPEKQDLGKEKRANAILDFVDDDDCNVNVLPAEKCVPTSSNNKTASKLQPKFSSKSNSGIPTSRLPSRSTPPKSLSRAESDFGTTYQSIDSCSQRLPDVTHLVDKPISCNQISSVSPCKNSSTNLREENHSPQEGNATDERAKNEAKRVPNEDLNRTYDVFPDDDGSDTSHFSGDADERRVSSSINTEKFSHSKVQFGINKKTNQDPQDNICVISSTTTDRSINVCSLTQAQSNISDDIPEDSSYTFREKNLYKSPMSLNSLEHINTSTPTKGKEPNKTPNTVADNPSPEFPFPPADCLVFNDKNGERLERSCNDSANVLDTRMLDPDAMIESLDRFTAELVSQASSHLQNKDTSSYMKTSTTDNTWDEHSSPNEVTFPSISVNSPNVVSFKSELDSSAVKYNSHEDDTDAIQTHEQYSNDFSSMNTSTMTESTLIAMEATKIAAAFREGVDLSLSANSLISLELDQVQPPSHLNSLSNSMIGFDSKPNSPKMVRKKSLPSNIMVRRALNHSLSHTSSFENFEHQYLAHADQSNAPAWLPDYTDMEGSTRSIPSLLNDGSSNAMKNFEINGPVGKNFATMSSNSKPTSSLLHFVTSHHMHSVTDIENINPPSLFNEITDMCNSLADVATSAICSETEVFEDCFTHVVADNTFRTENDATEFSDANSITPIQSDVTSSSSENTPKRQKTLSKSLTTKQRRALAKERYKTYTIAAEMVMRDSITSAEENEDEANSSSDNFNTARADTTTTCEDATFATYTVEPKISKLSPKERRQNDRSRFQTQVLEVSQLASRHITTDQDSAIDSESSSQPSSGQSPSRSRISVRKNFLQRRLSNQERFKTQTLSDRQFSPPPPHSDSPSNTSDSELYLMVEKEANKVLRTLQDTRIKNDDLLDCETLSLVSNEDESEHNSGGSVNYRTYHKSWGLRRDLPIIDTTADDETRAANTNDSAASDSENEANRALRKPKIVKPNERSIAKNNNEEEPKGVRGRRKPLYSKSNLNKITPKSIKPVKNMTSNLVKNVSSALKATTPSKSITKPDKVVTKPPTRQSKTPGSSRPVSGSGSPQKTPTSYANISLRNSPKLVASRTTSDCKLTPPKPLERQGTFTKDDRPIATPQAQIKSKIPGFHSKISSTGGSKLPTRQSNIPRTGLFKSASSDRAKNSNVKIYNRSTSADSHENALPRRIQSSLSTHSLRAEPAAIVQQNGAIKKTIQGQRSNSNASLNGSGNNAKKQVTSKIASIWKKIEESKKKATTMTKNDTKKWIAAQVESSSDVVDLDTVVLRNKENNCDGIDASKRISRLGSFVVMDENDDSLSLQ